MYEELKALFGKETPSVNKFDALLSELPPVRRLYYLRLAYKAAFSEWDIMTVRYQVFLTRLFTRDWQRTLNFLLEYTGHHPAFYRPNGKTQARLQTLFGPPGLFPASDPLL